MLSSLLFLSISAECVCGPVAKSPPNIEEVLQRFYSHPCFYDDDADDEVGHDYNDDDDEVGQDYNGDDDDNDDASSTSGFWHLFL